MIFPFQKRLSFLELWFSWQSYTLQLQLLTTTTNQHCFAFSFKRNAKTSGIRLRGQLGVFGSTLPPNPSTCTSSLKLWKISTAECHRLSSNISKLDIHLLFWNAFEDQRNAARLKKLVWFIRQYSLWSLSKWMNSCIHWMQNDPMLPKGQRYAPQVVLI